MSISVLHSTKTAIPSIETLPAEIIKRIASYLTCLSALNFSRVDHRFYALVFDRLVFASIIENEPSLLCQELSTNIDMDPSRPWTSNLSFTSVLSSHDSAEIWARFTLASQEAQELILRQSLTSASTLWEDHQLQIPSVQKENDTWQKLIQFAPQLFAFHHPCLSSPDTLIAVISLLPRDPPRPAVVPFADSPWNIDGHLREDPVITSTPPQILSKDQVYALDFTLTLLALQHGISSILSNSAPGKVDHWIMAMKRHLLARSSDAAKTHNGVHGPFVSVFICALIARLRRRQQQGKAPPIVWPPVTLNIPFGEFMDLPLPYQEDFERETADENVDWETTPNLQRCHVAKTCTPEFLTTGTWTAYYSLTMNIESVVAPPRFQPPTLDIQFSHISSPTSPSPSVHTSLDPPTSSETSPYILTATGSDHELFARGSEFGGQLTARGFMTRDGRMAMKETNYIGKTYYWHLEMVPAGLFGTWGNSDGGHSPRGYMWLFKTAWSAKIES